MDALQTSFNFASDLDKQLLTLATGILAFSITFRKEFDSTATTWAGRFLILSWISLFVCIPSGLATLGKLTAAAMNARPSDGTTILNAARPWAKAQEVAFLLGMIFLMVYAAIVLIRKKKTVVPESKDLQTTVDTLKLRVDTLEKQSNDVIRDGDKVGFMPGTADKFVSLMPPKVDPTPGSSTPDLSHQVHCDAKNIGDLETFRLIKKPAQ